MVDNDASAFIPIWSYLAENSAIDFLRAAVKRLAVGQMDEPARHCGQLREASMQLLDALIRLESSERGSQVHSKLQVRANRMSTEINTVRGQQMKSKAYQEAETIGNIYDGQREF